MKPFEIFRSGTHATSKGQTLTFTDSDLQAIAEKYDPALSEAPIVIGHPKTDGPAYGWVKSVTYNDGRLLIDTHQVETNFSDMVKDGRFKKRSASFFPPNHPNNPTPGQYYLRHVGFLGAEPPAVKGLKPVEFSQGDDCVEFMEAASASQLAYALETVGRMFRRIRERMIETDGVETANQAVAEWDIETLNRTAGDLRAPDPVSPFFSETTEETKMTDQATEERLAEIARREQQLKDSEIAFSEKQKAITIAEDSRFVAEMIAAGTLPAGLKDAAEAIFSDLSEDEITFSDGDGSKTTPREAFKTLLKGLPKPVTTAELAVGDGPDFSDPAHVALAIETEIRDAAARGEILSPASAAQRIQSRK